jgi:glyoxylase-like metal-dependent hydrolase (beta-lactamase superfamily II)
MFVRQLFNQESFSYTYLVADQVTMEAVLIDPVKEKLKDYVQLFNELGLSAIGAIDTHQHDDRDSALTALRDLWGCDAIAGAPTEIAGLTRTVQDGSVIPVGKTDLIAVHTPGHTVDSYSYLIEQPGKISVFTGDTLLVRTLGLSNQKTSDMETHYHSLFNVLMQLPDETLIYPGRDFKGWPLSTIAEEKAFNPYLQAESLEQFLELKQAQKAADLEPLRKGKKPVTGDRFKLEGARTEVRGENPGTLLDEAAGLADWR